MEANKSATQSPALNAQMIAMLRLIKVFLAVNFGYYTKLPLNFNIVFITIK